MPLYLNIILVTPGLAFGGYYLIKDFNRLVKQYGWKATLSGFGIFVAYVVGGTGFILGTVGIITNLMLGR